jgi:hypothetical protein
MRLLLLLLGFTSIFAPFSSMAAEMHSGKIRRSNASAYVAILGKIEAGDAEKFRQAVLRLIKEGQHLGSVYIYGPGGDVAEALNIGRQLRTLKAETLAPFRLTHPSFRPGINQCLFGDEANPTIFRYDTKLDVGDRRCVCMSACFLIWASGTGRFGDVIGVHRPAFSDQAWYGRLPHDRARMAYEQVIDEAKRYLNEMDIPASIVSTMLAVSSTNMHYLEKSELLQLRNDAIHLEELGIARCGRAPSVGDAQARQRWSDCHGSVYTGATNKAAIPEYLKAYGQK